ncbi:MAG: hypothetical protein GY820_22600 [Gammaproteobacteria bacterium]|nr:hypothetical protein [Gammaproteobacteria bacterium]
MWPKTGRHFQTWKRIISDSQVLAWVSGTSLESGATEQAVSTSEGGFIPTGQIRGTTPGRHGPEIYRPTHSSAVHGTQVPSRPLPPTETGGKIPIDNRSLATERENPV